MTVHTRPSETPSDLVSNALRLRGFRPAPPMGASLPIPKEVRHGVQVVRAQERK